VRIPGNTGAWKKWLAAIVGGLLVAGAAAFGLSVVFDGGSQNPFINAGEGQNLAGQPHDLLSSPQPQGSTSSSATSPSQRFERIVQDGWLINCAMANGKKTCSAVHQVLGKEQRQVVFAWAVGRNAQGAPAMIFRTPTGVQIQNGVEFKLGNAPARKIDYIMCNPQSCMAAMPVNDGVVREAMSALNGNAVATVTGADGRAVDFTMPVKGIDKVLAAIRG
jgi:invasion protein IalB